MIDIGKRSSELRVMPPPSGLEPEGCWFESSPGSFFHARGRLSVLADARALHPRDDLRMIRWLLVSWAANAVVLGITAWILSGVSVNGSGWTLIWAALVFGILNTILKPLLKLLTFPLAIFTLGIAWFFVSMLMLWLTDLIVGGFNVDGFWSYVWATIIVWAVNLVVDGIFRDDRGRESSPAPA